MDDKLITNIDSTNNSRTEMGSYLIILCFFFSHATFHFMSQSFSVMLPAVKETFGINPIQVGAIITAREMASGLAALPGGVLADYFRHSRYWLMSLCMVVFGLGWLFIGISPFYIVAILGMVLLGVASSIWHLPSLAELGFQFPQSRGAILAVHGAGGSTGDIFGPVLTGLLLGMISWRTIISSYFTIPLIMSFWIYWTFYRLENKETDMAQMPLVNKIDLKEQLKVTQDILKQTHMWRINLVAGFRGMCFTAIVTFLPLFMKEDLGFSSKSIGLHFGLIWTIGIITSPLMGHLSDRLGRKFVLVPALLYSSFLIILLSFFGRGVMFTILIALLGVSIRSDYSLIYASIFDIAGNQVVMTMLGVLSLTRFIMGAVSPLIAGALYQYSGMKMTLLFVATLFAIAAVIFSSVDMTKKA